jgi:hypothetical protein
MQPDESQIDGDKQVMISGDVQNPQFVQTGMQPQTVIIDPNTGLPQNVILMQQPSSAPKVIGVFVIIFGAIGVIGSALGLFGSSFLQMKVEDSVLDAYITQIMIFSLLSIFVSIGTILSGVWINNRQTRGVHLAWIVTGYSLLLSIGQQMTIPAELSDPSGLGQAIGIGFSVVCNGICGLIVAIPLMISGSGMDNTKLF